MNYLYLEFDPWFEIVAQLFNEHWVSILIKVRVTRDLQHFFYNFLLSLESFLIVLDDFSFRQSSVCGRKATDFQPSQSEHTDGPKPSLDLWSGRFEQINKEHNFLFQLHWFVVLALLNNQNDAGGEVC